MSIVETYRNGSYPEMLKSETFLARYDRIFAEIESDQPVIVELGVHAGGSLRLWKDVFPEATVIGFDLNPPKGAHPAGCTMVQGSQDNSGELRHLTAHADQFDIVIDDCSHIAGPTRTAFEALFPHVRPGGFYVIEDWGTGYWPTWPDGELPTSRNHLAGMVGFVKEFVDGVGVAALNRMRNPPPIHEANWSTKNSPYEYVTYYPGIVCIKKALPVGEPMHSPLDRREPSAGERLIDSTPEN